MFESHFRQKTSRLTQKGRLQLCSPKARTIVTESAIPRTLAAAAAKDPAFKGRPPNTRRKHTGRTASPGPCCLAPLPPPLLHAACTTPVSLPTTLLRIMSTAKHDCQRSVDEERPQLPSLDSISTLTPAQEKEVRRMGAVTARPQARGRETGRMDQRRLRKRVDAPAAPEHTLPGRCRLARQQRPSGGWTLSVPVPGRTPKAASPAAACTRARIHPWCGTFGTTSAAWIAGPWPRHRAARPCVAVVVVVFETESQVSQKSGHRHRGRGESGSGFPESGVRGPGFRTPETRTGPGFPSPESGVLRGTRPT